MKTENIQKIYSGSTEFAAKNALILTIRIHFKKHGVLTGFTGY